MSDASRLVPDDLMSFPDVVPCPACHGSRVHRWRTDQTPVRAADGDDDTEPNGVRVDSWEGYAEAPCPTCGGEGAMRLRDAARVVTET